MMFRNICLAILSIGSFIFFCFFYYNHLYQREQLQLFQTTFTYLLKNMMVQGGFSIWLGEFFTQFFRIRIAGAIIITVFLVLLQQLTEKLIIKVSGSRHFSLFSFLPSMLYLFLLTDQYYYLSGLIALDLSLAASLLLAGAARVKSGSLYLILAIIALYWLTGAGYIVFVLNSVILMFFFRGESEEAKIGKHSFIYAAIGLLAAAIIPLAARKLVVTDTLLQTYVSEAYYAVRIFFPLPLIIVMLSIPLILVISGLRNVSLANRYQSWIGIVFVILAVAIITTGFSFEVKFSEEKEIRYENLVYDKDWEGILKLARKDLPSGKIPLTAVNLALAETGQLPDRMFEFPQKKDFLFINYVRRGMTPFMASEPFFYLGLVNFSQMYAIETIESTIDAKLPVRSVRRVAETYLLNGQNTIAVKYLNLAKNTIFYRRWANKYLALIKSGKPVITNSELNTIKKLMPENDFYYDYQRMDVALKYLLLSNPENRKASGYLIAFYLLNKDFDGFLQNMPLLKKIYGQTLPVDCQEAIAYILTRLPQGSEELQSLVTDRNVVERLKSYAELFSTVGNDTAKMEKEFSHSYWFYLHYR